jgi:hypothetical protein
LQCAQVAILVVLDVEPYRRPLREEAIALSSPEPQPASPASSAPRSRARALGKRIAWGIAAFVVAVAAIIALVGPLWPVAPAFIPAQPSADSPLELSFTVKNRSALFALKHIQIVCMLVTARTQSNRTFSETGVTIPTPVSDLSPGQSATYSCPLNVAVDLREGDKIVRAKIDFISQYESRWPWGGRTRTESEAFTLNAASSPPQWLPGDGGSSR